MFFFINLKGLIKTFLAPAKIKSEHKGGVLEHFLFACIDNRLFFHRQVILFYWLLISRIDFSVSPVSLLCFPGIYWVQIGELISSNSITR